MKKLLAVAALCTAMIFAATAFAGTEFVDSWKMENTKAFKKHKKSLVEFSHKKHAEDYKVDCGTCHHDDKGQPLKLAVRDDVKECTECHKPGKAPKKEVTKLKADKVAKKKLQNEYMYGAMHSQCIDCHKAEKKGPTKCAECHPKKKK